MKKQCPNLRGGRARSDSLKMVSDKNNCPLMDGGAGAWQETAVVPVAQSGPVRQSGYFRKLKPAENYDVISFARAMNDDFAPKLKKLFDPETEAAKCAIQSGIYIGWRCPEFKHDCQRVGGQSKCFCGHLLNGHDSYSAKSARVKCKQGGCVCKAFAWIPSRVEDIGEFWHQKRPGFDPSAWRAKCRCKHTHEEHRADTYKCGIKGCSCFQFDSNFLCAACDKHWELHGTFFDSIQSRREKGLPTGEDYLPFAEIPQLRDIALTGHEASAEGYAAITSFFGPPGADSVPPPKAVQGPSEYPVLGADMSPFQVGHNTRFPSIAGTQPAGNRQPFSSSGNRQQFPGSGVRQMGNRPQFPGSGGQQMGNRPQFPGSGGQQMGNRPQFPGSGGQQMGNRPQFPGSGGQQMGNRQQFPPHGSDFGGGFR